jgi:phage protein U
MSKIQVNEIVNHFDNGSPDCPRGLTVTGVSTFSGSVSIGGTLTYEDVTNIDSVGIITAQQGLDAPTDLVLRTGGTERLRVTSAGITSVTTDSLVVNGNNYPATGALSNRNLIINGAMQVAQRGDTVSNITSGTTYPTADRYRFDVSMGTWTSDRMTNSQGNTYESGSTERFRNSIRLTCTTGETSPAATNNVKVVYFVEGQDAQQLDYGTSNAKTTTCSFWVRSSKTGTGTLELIQEDNSDKQFSASYTIYAANTWEKKVITIPGDSSGVINNDNGRGLDLIWWLNSGSTFTGGTQATGGWRNLVSANRNSDNLAIGSANNDEWFLTGVQLEVGTRATPFEHESYSQTLLKCQRYYYRHPAQRYRPALVDGNGSYMGAFVTHPVQMRTSPSITCISFNVFYYNTGSGNASLVPNGSITNVVYSGDELTGIPNVTGISNIGVARDQQTGQWQCQFDFSSEL